MSLALAEDDNLQDARCCCYEQCGDFAPAFAIFGSHLDSCDRLLRIVYYALPCPFVVDEVSPDDGNRAVREPDSNLTKVIGGRECRDLVAIHAHVSLNWHNRSRYNGHTGNCFFALLICTVLKQVGKPVFLTGLSSAQTFSTGSLLRSSAIACPLNLSHVRNSLPRRLAIVIVAIRPEAPHDLPAGADDTHMAVVAAEEEAVGAGTDARDLVALEECARVVVTELYLLDVEEVK
ncbi:hypothetical protein PoMZ_07855 [Pyricularia oryzae]|uniref:Uncharacterized protein n=1 Tax=Pyricularia oryzae TaxID=318829 RepID=A0A4P7NG55_PYROR|nr:hypothetical protein PoMZ_07855 [Pyricularia oryzae]